MTPTKWILLAAFLVGGLIVGITISRLIFRALAKETRPKPLRDAAAPLSSLFLWAGVIGGLIGALGVISPEALDQLPRDLIAFLPRLLSAAIIVIMANVMSSFALTALGPALSRASATVQRQISMAVRGGIVALAGLLAVSQLGIETTVLNLGVAAVFFALAASFALLVGLGGRGIAAEVAATRVLRRQLHAGDQIGIDDVRGVVVAVHPTTVEIQTGTGQRVLLPSSQVTGSRLIIERRPVAEPS